MKYAKNNTNIFIFTLLLCALPLAVSAESTITNSISVSSHTGGNQAQGGEITTGSTNNSVQIHTTINGETITDINKQNEEETIFIEETIYLSDNHEPTVQNTTLITEDTSLPIAVDEPLVLKNITSKQDFTHTVLPHIITSYSKTMAYVLSQLF